MSSAPDDLDFTRPDPAPAAPPSPQQVAAARSEANLGGPHLEKKGFYVSMARHATGKVTPRDGARHGVLIVEDDEALANLVAEVLSGAGFATRTASNKAQIQAEFNRAPLPDVLLLDVSLPDADGFDILQRIRANPRIAKVPVIMMTGKSEVTDIARGLSLGADGYVTKPFKLSGLVAAVNTVLGLD